ncbi:hypothetical protein B0H19DRAFT_1247397 [Mycena capillaripes]|nr:hypothetical protein B0H19DRAFT_1247397 [Mycena capillaripes]
MAQFFWNCGAPPPPLLDTSSSEPDLTRLLTSNHPPIESEIPLIRDIISEGKDRTLDVHIDTLAAQIEDLGATVAPFVRRCNEMIEHLRQHRAVISPVRRLPSELICEILGLIWASSSLENKEAMAQEPPWYIGHICGPWRHCAISYPTFWSSITVPFKCLTRLSYPTLWISDGERQDRQLSMIKEQLLRSANAPLDVYWPDVNDEFDPRLMALVISHCSRWRNSTLVEPLPSFFLIFAVSG